MKTAELILSLATQMVFGGKFYYVVLKLDPTWDKIKTDFTKKCIQYHNSFLSFFTYCGRFTAQPRAIYVLYSGFWGTRHASYNAITLWETVAFFKCHSSKEFYIRKMSLMMPRQNISLEIHLHCIWKISCLPKLILIICMKAFIH